MADIEQTPITFRTAAYVIAGCVSVVSFLVWMDQRVDDRISERIAPLERRLSVIERNINEGDKTRNEQYLRLLQQLKDMQDGR